MSTVRQESDVAYPRQLAFDCKERETRCSPCCSAKSFIFYAKCLEEEAIDDPDNWVNLKNALVIEKDRLGRYQRIADYDQLIN